MTSATRPISAPNRFPHTMIQLRCFRIITATNCEYRERHTDTLCYQTINHVHKCYRLVEACVAKHIQYSQIYNANCFIGERGHNMYGIFLDKPVKQPSCIGNK